MLFGNAQLSSRWPGESRMPEQHRRSTSEVGHLRYGSAPERRTRILDVVTNEGFCTIAELARSLDVSEMTVRRDVALLERAEQVRRVHGGLTVLSRDALYSSDFTKRAAEMMHSKRAIAQTAIHLLDREASIGIDAGTTMHQLALLLPDDLKLTVASHSLPVLNALLSNPGVQVIGLGGELHPLTQDFAGLATREAIANLHLSVLFLAARSLSNRGVFCASDHEALVKRKLLEVADRVVVLADSTKLTSSAMVRVCGLDRIDCIVMDDGVSPEAKSLFLSHGIKLIVANEDHGSRSDGSPTSVPQEEP
jgi:DeoR/GlpR family transcriptional regulator of sugar metabolism